MARGSETQLQVTKTNVLDIYQIRAAGAETKSRKGKETKSRKNIFYSLTCGCSFGACFVALTRECPAIKGSNGLPPAFYSHLKTYNNQQLIRE